MDISPLYTFSGILAIVAAISYVVNRLLLASVLLLSAGAGGMAVAWDRWSQRTGEQVHLTAFTNPVAPSLGEVVMFTTHFPMLLVGLVLLAFTVRR